MFIRVMAVLMLSGLALGQAVTTGSISGTTTDPSGGVVPGAQILVLAAGPERAAITNQSGQFKFDGLPAGVYELRAKLAGFLTARRQITVVAGKTATWDPVLRVFAAKTIDPPDGVDPTDATLARGVYDAVIRHVFRGEPREAFDINSLSLVVMEMADSEWFPDVLSYPSDLRAEMVGPRARKSHMLRAESFAPPARLVSDRDFNAHWTVIGVTRPSRLALTRVFASAVGLDALVYYEFRCGSLCGNGTLVWLRRISQSSPWLTYKASEFWVS